ncbi:hypothetical protein Taro_035293 [Colocasia esculenta]|uniref:Uncharacterized protein n=1 Tax=Colocasia esculenta TaxID=4460 RepID=A0A843WA56_COLES|nr:hypothetical protein [Colocasia esculenta]
MFSSRICMFSQVPSLEHNNEVKGESLDLLKYIDTHFEGPVLLPNDPAKRQFAEEFLSYSDAFNHISLKAFTSNDDFEKEVGPSYDRIEDSLSKFDDGPFFLGQFSLVDAAYAPFIERFQPLFAEVRNYDITKGRPKLALWIQELNKIEAYRQTQLDPSIILGALKYKLGVNFIPSAESQTLTEVAFQVFLFQLSLADGCCAYVLLCPDCVIFIVGLWHSSSSPPSTENHILLVGVVAFELVLLFQG